MRLHPLLPGLFVLATGCATAAPELVGVTARSMEDGYSCAVQQLNALGYTVEAGDREAGFVRGRKARPRLPTYMDVITVAVFQEAGQTRMRATALTTTPEVEISGSDEAIANGRTILTQCGVTLASR